MIRGLFCPRTGLCYSAKALVRWEVIPHGWLPSSVLLREREHSCSVSGEHLGQVGGVLCTGTEHADGGARRGFSELDYKIRNDTS